MQRVRRLSHGIVGLAAVCITGVASLGCDQMKSDLVVERLPDVKASVPEPPTLPPPPHPIQYNDKTYSVYGVRKKIRATLDKEVEVTAYIVNVYTAPECPKRETCPRPLAPHMYVADTPGETNEGKWLMVVGYAENQEQITAATKAAARGAYKPPDPESGQLPIPTDFVVGNTVKLKGKFSRLSGAGFNNSEGLLEYKGHTTVAKKS